MAATAQQIQNGSKIAAGDMARQLGWVKVFKPSAFTHAGINVRLLQDPSDPDLEAKLTGLKVGLTRVVNRGFAFPNGITFYCTNMPGVLSIAFHRDFSGGRQAAVLLGASCVDAGNPGMFAGVAHAVAPGGGANYCAAVVTHELGHNLHERANEGLFWDGASAGAAEPLANQVTPYATKNVLEFVAEVFTGRMYGRTYSANVMNQYAAHGGPTCVGFP